MAKECSGKLLAFVSETNEDRTDSKHNTCTTIVVSVFICICIHIMSAFDHNKE